jgi:hypothetical protein
MGAIKFLSCLVAVSIVSFSLASPCPYGQLAKRGQLPAAETAKFFEARAAGDTTVEDMIAFVKKREVSKHQILGGILGGGLLNGVLQPFTGILAFLDGTWRSTAIGLISTHTF